MKRQTLTVVGIIFLTLPIFASAASCPNLYRNLAFGSRGTDVGELQSFLITKGDLATSNNTGYFGRLTEAAVKKFQCREMQICTGSTASNGYGVVGPRTRAAIVRVCSQSSSSSSTTGVGQTTDQTTTGTGTGSVGFFASPSSGTAPLSVVFRAAVEWSTMYSVDFGDGQSGSLQNNCPGGGIGACGQPTATHTYSNAGTYTARLIKSDPGGCGPNADPRCLGAPASVHVLSTIVISVSSAGTIPPSPTSCAPLPPQTQTLACPSGQTGSITQTRTSSCPGPTWSVWQTTSNTCAIQPIGAISEQTIPVAFNEVVIKGVAAGTFDKNKLKNWNPYYFSHVITAENTALANIYAANLHRLPSGAWKLFYGGWDSSNPQDHTDRTYNAMSSNFLGKSTFDFTPPIWTNRKLVITDKDGLVANDPTVVSYEPGKYLMLYSAANGLSGADNITSIASAVSTDLDSWYTNYSDKTRLISVDRNGTPVTFMHRPSLVMSDGMFYLYYDQGGDPAATKNNGFTIRVARGLNGLHFSDLGEVFATGSPENGYAGTPDVQKFGSDWIMFYDRHMESLAYGLSTDGLHFTDMGILTSSDKQQTVTNAGIIRDGNRLLGVIYGAAPKKSAYGSCDLYWVIGDYCFAMHMNAFFLQKKVVFTADSGEVWSNSAALDEDRVVLKIPTNVLTPVAGVLRIYDTDGTTLIAQKRVTLSRGILYSVSP
ncbi:MAG: peptidoglycan-binding protein [Candidatus Komeilibacteria bacterium]|nr:peptidoglycan-binding protein [Candidatus Komeilibacteria bacterium]